MTVAYLANHIRNYFGDGSDFGVRMRYATEESPLGTAGSVRNAQVELDDTFLVISGDVLTDLDLTAFVEAHRANQAFASIALKRVENPVDFGIVITKADGEIERFLEKPTWGQVFSDTINTGIYVLEPEVFDFIGEGAVVDFASDVFPAALDRELRLHGHVTDALLGGRRHHRGLSERPRRRPRRQGLGRHHRVRARRRDLARGGRRRRPQRARRRSGGDRRQLPRRGRGPPLARTPCSAPTS